MELSIKILNTQGMVVAENKGTEEVGLVYSHEYQDGDQIRISISEPGGYLMVQVDDALGSAYLYVAEPEITYFIPFKEKRISYSPKAFSGELHYLWAREATEVEIKGYRNLALNVMDQHEAKGFFPHAYANVETRGEAVFAARNAIDGVRENHSHGEWPYQSWGINRQEDAYLRLDFGRKVKVNKVVLYNRADFPHDNWWKSVSLQFSDGTTKVWELTKSDKAHVLNLEEKVLEWLILCDLIKSEEPSPFPALTQIEVYGTE